MHILRTLLFVPVVEPRFLAKAHLRGADALILDLEDSIAPARKDEARSLVKAASAGLSGHGVRVFVRINSAPGVTEADAAEAEEIVRVYEHSLSAGLGAVAFRGRMIDMPVYERALATNRRARLIAQARK